MQCIEPLSRKSRHLQRAAAAWRSMSMTQSLTKIFQNLTFITHGFTLSPVIQSVFYIDSSFNRKMDIGNIRGRSSKDTWFNPFTVIKSNPLTIYECWNWSSLCRHTCFLAANLWFFISEARTCYLGRTQNLWWRERMSFNTKNEKENKKYMRICVQNLSSM
jgi:hypothetical protein